jgi:hypothetical protein
MGDGVKMYEARCEKCNKLLMIRQDNGLWRFQFGRYGANKTPVVDMEIHGSVRITCIRKTCRHPNVFDFFPNKV